MPLKLISLKIKICLPTNVQKRQKEIYIEVYLRFYVDIPISYFFLKIWLTKEFFIIINTLFLHFSYLFFFFIKNLKFKLSLQGQIYDFSKIKLGSIFLKLKKKN